MQLAASPHRQLTLFPRQKRRRVFSVEVWFFIVTSTVFLIQGSIGVWLHIPVQDVVNPSFQTRRSTQIHRNATSPASVVSSNPYAYAFIIGGIHETHQAYLGYFYNVLVAVRLLRRLGSKADFVCYLQLSNQSKLEEPPHLEWLHQMNISDVILPVPNDTSLASLMFSKFEALQLTQYRRVMYLDSDILPLSNLDYLFELSDPRDTDTPTLLQPNVIQASRGEPADGGLFIMEPRPGIHQRLQNVMSRQRQDFLQRQKESEDRVPPFDKKWGWGHDFIRAGDEWQAINRKGSIWTYQGARADQGLLHYFFKYELQQVSVIIGRRVENWIPKGDGTPQLATVYEDIFLPYSSTPLVQCSTELGDYQCQPPYRDFHHFAEWKPWQNPTGSNTSGKKWAKRSEVWSTLWFMELEALNEEVGLGLDIQNWNEEHLKESPLGYDPQRESSQDVYSEGATMMEIEVTANETAWADLLPSPTTTSPYAYAFIVGSVHENNTAYKGFLYNVLISVQLLQHFGSRADFVVYMQLSPTSQLSELPVDDIRFLSAMKIRVLALPKPQAESFTDLMFDKFRIFQLTQYRRVMYLDADMMPLTNLDYLFELSDPDEHSVPTPLLPNVMQASSGEPANGGLFMVRPFDGAWELIQKVIAQQQDDGKGLPYPNFHRGRGWGHTFRKKIKDNWHAATMNGTNWVFHGAHADQGLLYYFFRFVLQNCSHIVGRRVENWVSNVSNVDAPYIGSSHDGMLMEFSNRQPPIILSCPRCNSSLETEMEYTCYPPYRDFHHFVGRSKPWQNTFHEQWLKPAISSTEGKHLLTSNSKEVWFKELQKLNKRLGIGINFTEWNTCYLPRMKESPLGYLPLYRDNTNRIFENHSESYTRAEH